MTLTEIVGEEAYIEYKVEIDYKTTPKMTVRKKLWGDPKLDIEVDIEISMETCVMTGTKIIAETPIKIVRDKYRQVQR